MSKNQKSLVVEGGLDEVMRTVNNNGWVEGHCPDCNEYYRLEPDGYTECSCGAYVVSPLRAMSMI